MKCLLRELPDFMVNKATLGIYMGIIVANDAQVYFSIKGSTNVFKIWAQDFPN